MTLKTRIIPCLDVKDGRTSDARSTDKCEDAQNKKNDADRKFGK